MGDRYKKVQAGEPLSVSADVWNALIDLTRAKKGHQHDQTVANEFTWKQADIAPVRNASGVDLERFAVVSLDAPIIAPSDNLLEFKQRVAMRVGLPRADTLNRFGVLLEPLANGAIGRAVMAGVVIVRIAVGATLYPCAEPVAGVASYMKNVPHGPASLLWIETSGGIRWAIIRLGQSNEEEIVYITSNRPDSEGYYPGIVQWYSPVTKSWISKYPCKVLDANR